MNETVDFFGVDLEKIVKKSKHLDPLQMANSVPLVKSGVERISDKQFEWYNERMYLHAKKNVIGEYNKKIDLQTKKRDRKKTELNDFNQLSATQQVVKTNSLPLFHENYEHAKRMLEKKQQETREKIWDALILHSRNLDTLRAEKERELELLKISRWYQQINPKFINTFASREIVDKEGKLIGKAKLPLFMMFDIDRKYNSLLAKIGMTRWRSGDNSYHTGNCIGQAIKSNEKFTNFKKDDYLTVLLKKYTAITNFVVKNGAEDKSHSKIGYFIKLSSTLDLDTEPPESVLENIALAKKRVPKASLYYITETKWVLESMEKKVTPLSYDPCPLILMHSPLDTWHFVDKFNTTPIEEAYLHSALPSNKN